MSEIERIVSTQITTGTTTSSTPSGAGSAAKNDNTIFNNTKKKDLTQEEIKLLKSLGIDPNDTVAVEQWRALPKEERAAQMNQYYMNAEANKSTTPANPTPTAQTTQVSTSSDAAVNTGTSAQTAAAETPDTAAQPTTTAATVSAAAAETVETPTTEVADDTTAQPKTLSNPSPQTEESADGTVTSANSVKQGVSDELTPPPIIEAKPASLASMATSESPTEITINKMDFLQNISEEQWKSYSEEQRLYLLQEALGDQFKEELNSLSSEQRYDVIMGMVDNEIKKERGISDEKWENYSDDRKMKLRLKYGTSFAVAIEKGYTREDLDNLSAYERTKAEIDAYNNVKSSVLSQIESGTIDEATQKRLAQYDQKMQERIELTSIVDQLAEYSSNKTKSEIYADVISSDITQSLTGNSGTTGVADAVKQAADNVKSEVAPDTGTEKTSYINKFEEEIGMKSADIKSGDKVSQRKYIKSLAKYIENKELEGKTPEERQAYFKELITSGNIGDKNQTLYFTLALKLSGKNQEYYTEFTKVLNEINNSSNLNNTEKSNTQEVLDVVVDATDKNEDSTESITNVASAVESSNSVELASHHKERLKGSEQDISDVVAIYANSNNKDMQKGVGELTASLQNDDAKIKSTEYIAEANLKEELTEAFKPAEGKKADGELQLKQQEAALTANPKSVVVNQALKDATVYIDTKVVNEYFDKGFEATKNLAQDDQVTAQKGWADVIKDCDASVQLDMHKTVMTSQFDEVLEHASSNIYQYDKSVQADAIKISYDTGNQKAIDAVNAQLDKCDAKAVEAVGSDVIARETQATETRYTQEVAKQVAEFNQKYQELTGTTAQDNILPDAEEQKVNFVKNFLSATPQEQYKLLSKIPQAWQGTVFSKICQYCPNLLSGLVKQGYGKQILKTPGMPSDVIYKVINTMLTCGASDKKDASKYVVDHKYLFTESTLERCEEILASSKGREKKYSSAPIGGGIQSALQPGMSAIYPDKKDMFYKA